VNWAQAALPLGVDTTIVSVLTGIPCRFHPALLIDDLSAERDPHFHMSALLRTETSRPGDYR